MKGGENIEKALLNLKEFCEYMGIGKTKARELLNNPKNRFTVRIGNRLYAMILSRLVDTFISRISLTMLPVPNPHNTVCVLSGEEARHWQSRSSGYSDS